MPIEDPFGKQNWHRLKSSNGPPRVALEIRKPFGQLQLRGSLFSRHLDPLSAHCLPKDLASPAQPCFREVGADQQLTSVKSGAFCPQTKLLVKYAH